MSSLLNLGGQNSLYLFFVIHTSAAEADAENLSNAFSRQGMASLLQTPKHTSYNLYLVTSNDKHFPKPTRLNFEVKNLASRICFLALFLLASSSPFFSHQILNTLP